MERLLQDSKYALRHWRKRPAVALLIILTLALGVGANAAIFSLVHSSLMKPLPFPEPERLVAVYSQFTRMKLEHFWVSPPEVAELSRWAKSFSAVGAYRVRSVNVQTSGEPLRVRSATATAGLFPALGTQTLLGRAFGKEEDVPGAAPVAVLSQALWQRAFGSDPAIVGRSIQVDGVPTSVVGVMPEGFDVEDAKVDLWLPFAQTLDDPNRRGNHMFFLVARLAPGVTPEAAQREVDGLVARWREEVPEGHVPSPDAHPFVLAPLKEDLVGSVRPQLLVLAGAVCLVLLIACANVANLLLARAEGRQREVAVRTALGAGRGRLARLLLTESVLLSLAGGLLGMIFAVWAVNAVLAANPRSVVRVSEVSLNVPLLAYTLAVAVGTGLLFGLAPALHARAGVMFGALKEGARSSAGRGANLLRSSLVVGEVALAFVLVIAAGLLVQSFGALSRVDAGFEARSALTFELSLPDASYPAARDVVSFYDRLLAGISALPGVESAAAMNGLPPVRTLDANDTEFEGVPQPPEGPIHNVDYWTSVTGDIFGTLGIELVKGRAFSAADQTSTTPVVMVNQRLAEVFWPNQDPIGKRLRPYLNDETPWFTVIGVVENVKQNGLNRPAGTELYLSSGQVANLGDVAYNTLRVVVRTAGDPLALASAVRAEVRRLDPALPVASLSTLEDAVAGSMTNTRLLTFLVSTFGILALLLAAIGTYGVLSYAVEERRHEMGVRLALGSEASDVQRLILAHGLKLVGLGILLGIAGALAAQKVLGSVLFEVAPTDPATFVSVAAILLAVALFACLIPARRATRVDPLVVLRAS